MRVNSKELIQGCIVTEDIFGLTNRPILPKKTIIGKEHLEILAAFLIKEVSIEKTLVTGELFVPQDILEEVDSSLEETRQDEELNFTSKFLMAVRDYKKEFTGWQSGLPVDISKIRSILLPLLESSQENPADIFHLHHLSTKEDYLYQHSLAVGILCGFIAKKLNYNQGDMLQVALAGCLADCGMAKVKTSILTKQSSLTMDEYNEIKYHPTYGYRMIQNIPLLRDVTKVSIFQHHERLDGSGYPLREKGEKIHPFAKIIGVADTFHAMTSERLYRKKQSPFKVLEMMAQEQFGKFDIASIQALASGFINFSIGTRVKLSNGDTAEIMFVDEKSPTRPLVKLIDSEQIIALEKNRQLYIEEVIK
ncbi:HD-GYP domain-containing protein [Cytobacillus spongiae]|uniref:HD-GYP domain-containing protein n=1 Tax=Cytobacillus spongiae TaxID=2901381 RepID=UPI001F3B8821|nr:HD-GYP domain-containing protein [Cytobacillus spongiae]UII55971.1 HD-GYP domain-containing protein [Cytobacillus spongiae]